MTVNVPGVNLNPAADVKVVVRVTEAMIWPTTLRNAVAAHLPNVTATWEAMDDVPAAAGPYHSLSAAGPPTDPDPSFSLKDMRIGYKYKITIEAVPK